MKAESFLNLSILKTENNSPVYQMLNKSLLMNDKGIFLYPKKILIVGDYFKSSASYTFSVISLFFFSLPFYFFIILIFHVRDFPKCLVVCVHLYSKVRMTSLGRVGRARETHKEGDTHVLTADSRWCTAETNSAL